jgi:putative pyoverdin transport system ATP-binding/permease protein
MSNLGRLLSFLLKFSRQVPRARVGFALVVLLGILGGFSNTALLAVINSRLQGDTSRRLFWSFVSLCVAMPLARLISNLVLVRLTQKTILEVRLQLSRRILRAPLAQLERTGAARLLAALTEDVSTISASLISLPLLAMYTTIVIGTLFYLGWLSWKGLLIVLGFMIVGLITFQLSTRWSERRFQRARQHADALFRSLRALTDGIKELKLHWRRQRDFLDRGLEKTSIDLQREAYLGTAASVTAASWGQILFFIVVGIVLYVLPSIQRVEPGVLTGYAMAILYMMAPLEVILNTLPQLSRGAVAVKQVESLGLSLLESAPHETPATADPEPEWKELRLERITHSYVGEDQKEGFTLGPIDLSFYPRELVFLVGGNGSGKTTLAKLLVGLYTPQSGQIRLDGQVIGDDRRDLYRQLFAAVFSDFFLFETLFGLDHGEIDQQARRYLKSLQLEEKLEVRDGVLSTTKLSQGQRKRLALLTAYLENRPIYLFDEWAADQDPAFKQIFYYQLLPELKARGKTVVVISHDDRYYGVADRIIKLEYGKLQSDRSLAETLDRMAVP